MDFIRDPPLGQGLTTMWVVLDCFSKIAHFDLLSGLSSSSLLAQTFPKEIFQFHGLPQCHGSGSAVGLQILL